MQLISLIYSIAYKNQFKYEMHVSVACALGVLLSHTVTNLSPLSKTLQKILRISSLKLCNSFCTAAFGKNYIKLYFESHKMNTEMTNRKRKMETHAMLTMRIFFLNWYAIGVIPIHKKFDLLSRKFNKFRKTNVASSISTAQIRETADFRKVAAEWDGRTVKVGSVICWWSIVSAEQAETARRQEPLNYQPECK